MSLFRKFPRTFWVANAIELFERWAWYGFFMLFALYLTGSTETGSLGLSQSEKGWIMGVGTAILYFLPLITGALADKYGYKKMLFISFVVYASAFVILPHSKTFPTVFATYLYLACGAALFKPIISATIAKTTTDETSSIGFGIFYMMINIGGFLGPLLTMMFRSNSYDLVFYISAGIILLNFILLIFYKEPPLEKKDEPFSQALATIFKNIFTALKDYKFAVFLLIVAGFWTMFYQLYYTLPVFITQWVDTSSMYDFFTQHVPFIANNYGANGLMDAEFITNFDALFIIIFQIIVSALVMRLKPLNAMMTGFLVCSVGMALSLATQNVMFTIVAIFIFAVGEMASSPKIIEYIGKISPKDKLALYMGCSFLPVFLGNILAGIVSGNVYSSIADKDLLVQKEMAVQGFTLSEGLSKNAYFEQAAAQMNLSTKELTNMLWEKYQPGNIWIIIFLIGLMAAVALFVYDRKAKKTL